MDQRLKEVEALVKGLRERERRRSRISLSFLGILVLAGMFLAFLTGWQAKTIEENKAAFDQFTLEHLISLREFHIRFIQDYTFEEGKQWNHEEFDRKRDEGELMFRKALDYEKYKKKRDELRENAVNILYDQFKADCEFLENRAREEKYFFSKPYAKELKGVIEENYRLAIEGEKSRPEGAEKE